MYICMNNPIKGPSLKSPKTCHRLNEGATTSHTARLACACAPAHHLQSRRKNHGTNAGREIGRRNSDSVAVLSDAPLLLLDEEEAEDDDDDDEDDEEEEDADEEEEEGDDSFSVFVSC